MNTVRAELHLHTVLSPCAEVEMIPPLIVEAALARGLNIIAVTDHNASGNVAAVQKAAQGSNLTVLPGMELQTREAIHVLCLFDTLAQMAVWQSRVNGLLPPLTNDPTWFGEQYIVDETGYLVGHEKRLLLTSVDISLAQAVREVTALGGLAIPAHVDRKTFGLLGNPAITPGQLALAALEISRNISPAQAIRQYPSLAEQAILQGGDAHRLDEIVGLNVFEIEQPTILEMSWALAGVRRRQARIMDPGEA